MEQVTKEQLEGFSKGQLITMYLPVFNELRIQSHETHKENKQLKERLNRIQSCKILRVRLESFDLRDGIEQPHGGHLFKFIGDTEQQIKSDMQRYLDHLPVPYKAFLLFERIDKGEEISMEFYAELWEDDQEKIIKEIHKLIDKAML